MSLRETALALYNSGLNVLPAIKAQKRPALSWKQYVNVRPAFDDAFPANLNFDALAVVCGKTSGGLEIIDFDQKATLYQAWQGLVSDKACDLVVERSQSGGKHVAFRSASCGRNQKLAMNADGCAIETRGEGGICLIAPSPGYELESGDWSNVKFISDSDRNVLLDSARALSKEKSIPLPAATKATVVTFPSAQMDETPADYVRRIEAGKGALQRHGWTYLRENDTWEYWQRPGQTVVDKPGASYHKQDKYFHIFTSNAAPFEPDKTYSHLQIIALLDFGGDETAASREWGRQSRFPRTVNVIETFNPFDVPSDNEILQAEVEPVHDKRKVVFPERLYNVGGLLQEIQDLINKNAIRPQPEGAFLGALADVSFLCSRSIALNYNGTAVTPNIYALFLAPSGMGKEIIRRVGSEIARVYNPNESVPESFASVQALQNLISRIRKVYWLHDEFGRDLAVMNQTKTNANITGVITESLKLFSNANNRAYLPRLIAQEAKGAKHIDPVDRPSLTIFATGNPREFFDATNEQILSNGYISRFTTVQGRSYSEKKDVSFEEAQDAEIFKLPTRLTTRVKQWADMESRATESPFYFKFDKEAFDCLKAFDAATEKDIEQLSTTDGGSAEFKARLFEKLWKYALLFAASKFGPYENTEIDLDCAENAVALASYESDIFDLNKDRFASNSQTRFMIEVRDWAQALPGRFFTKSQFTRKFQRKGSLRERDECLHSLLEAEYIALVEIDGKKGFRLI